MATVEIGIEVKILMKALIKQIDRVMSDLVKQVPHFRRGGGQPICVAIVGINHADHCTSYEGERQHKTDGKKHKHPVQEAEIAEERIVKDARPAFDEMLILRLRETNEPPFTFEGVNRQETVMDYGAILTRVSRLYDQRF
jgi:hypothetical protein